MASVKSKSSLQDYQDFVYEVYGPGNLRAFSADDMLTNVTRFTMRGLKGIRKNDPEKIRKNIIIAFSWFMSFLNQYQIQIEDQVWNRFPYLCSYCGEKPCACKSKKIKKRVEIKTDNKFRPKTIKELQKNVR